MAYFLLPPALSGLTWKERKKLQRLPWKTGQIQDIEKGDYSFILVSGQLYDNDQRFHDPAREILGIKPFFRNYKKKYQSGTIHQIVYIETTELAKFFLESPKAMQSYVLYESNAGMESLAPWKRFPRVWTILSIQSTWQGIHFAFTLAGYLANKKNQRTVYLEFNRSGLSIFSFIDKEPRPPIMHIREDRLPDPAMVLMERTLSVDNVDIVNVQYLSQWNLTYDQWVTFYNTLAQKYDHIVINCGEDRDCFLHEESDGLFVFRKNKTIGFGALHPSENYDLWPPGMEIFTTSLPGAKDAEIKYPLFYKKIIDVKNIPFYNQLDESYWSWFEKYPAKIVNRERAVILGECSPSLVDPEAYLPQIIGPEETISTFLKNNLVITEGLTGLLTSLRNTENYDDKYIAKILRKIKPVYPHKGLYLYKSFLELLEDKFGNLSQEFVDLNYSVYCGDEMPLHWFTHGLISDNLSTSVFPPYFLEPLSSVPQTRDFAASNKSKWYEHIALAFRFGLKHVDFYEFVIPPDGDASVFAERFILSYNSIKNSINLTGKMSRHFYMFPDGKKE